MSGVLVDLATADAAAALEQQQREVERDGTLGVLLPFQRALVEQMLEEDGVSVLAPGLGLHQVAAVLLRLQDVRLRDPAQRGAVLVIGASAWQREALRQELLRVDPDIRHRAAAAAAAAAAGAGGSGRGTGRAASPAAFEVPVDVTADVASAERQNLYHTRSCLFVTTRILVVDLLSGRLAGEEIAGIIVLNAHRVSDSSGEGFAVRLFKSAHPAGFVRAFSDAPAAFTSDFGKAEKVLKALHVRRLYLWPRFQVQVQEDLEARPPELVELSQPADPGAALVYEALSELMDACVKELRKNERLDTTDLTASRGLFASFDESVRRQLAPVWHTVAPRTRQIVADLRTLRALASFLLRFDAVTFLTYLDTLRATEGTRCVWLFHSAAHTVFEAAKARVYRLGRAAAPATKKRKQQEQEGGGGGGAASTSAAAALGGSGTVPVVEPVLQELPKWHALQEVLEEVGRERAALLEEAAADAAAGEPAAAAVKRQAGEASVVVFCQDAFTCAQLKEVLGPDGPAGLMRRLYREYLQYKLDSGATKGRRGGSGSEQQPAGGKNGVPGGGGGGAPASRMMGGYKPGEEVALVKEAKAVAVVPAAGGPGRGGRGGGRGGAGRVGRGRGRKGSSVAMEAEAAAASAISAAAAAAPPAPASAAAATGDPAGAAPAPTAPGWKVDAPGGVHLAALDSHNCLALWDSKPAFVVVYDPDVALTRSLEVYKAARRGRPLRVYLLRYEDSPEMDRYQSSVVRERSAFEGLIKAKEIMSLPVTLAVRGGAPQLGGGALHEGVGALLPGPANNALTRRAGGRASSCPAPRRVVIDVREFMSPLPAVLHAKGLELVPLTLEVGDYVLSPEICIERKSLPDLRGSLASGRLYQQAEAMCRWYKTPVLLVEFEGDRAFALQAASDLGDDVQVHSLMSRLTLLCLHFPRLRLIWSRSLHATADIFRQLKANQEEPEPAAAAAVGVPQDAQGCGEAVVNQAAVDLLRRLPGVTEGNWRAVMREAGSLAGVAALPEGRLAAVMGGEAAARKLREFLDQECRALFRAL